MSELKVTTVYDAYWKANSTGEGTDILVYLKSEADAEIRRLKRALYKACAEWANVEVFERTIGIDDPNVEANRWALMRNKCLKKVEEYR